MTTNELGYQLCPEHGDTLGYHDDQGDDEWEQREHLACFVDGCPYEVWA